MARSARVLKRTPRRHMAQAQQDESARSTEESSQFSVDSSVILPEDTPKALLLALRRQLRRHDLGRLLDYDQSQKSLLSIMKGDGQSYRLPQALLSLVTETCRRQDIEFTINDRRSVVNASPLQLSYAPSNEDEAAIKRLELKDSGVLVASDNQDQKRLIAALLSRRQQRTLIIAEDHRSLGIWQNALNEFFTLNSDQLSRLSESRTKTDIALTYYEALTPGDLVKYRQSFGQVIFTGVDRVNPIKLLTILHHLQSRYLVGIAEQTVRDDKLHGPLYLVLGGVSVEYIAQSENRALRLAYRSRQTPFEFEYEGRQDYQNLVAALALDPKRNQQIVDDILLEAQAEERCLVLSERRDHLKALADELGSHVDVAIISSDIRPAQRAELVSHFNQGQIRVLLATSQIAVEAIRSPLLSRLFITYPFSQAQKLERIASLLLAPAPEKKEGAIYDYDDVAVIPLHRTFEKRKKIVQRIQRKSDSIYQKWAQLSLGV